MAKRGRKKRITDEFLLLYMTCRSIILKSNPILEGQVPLFVQSMVNLIVKIQSESGSSTWLSETLDVAAIKKDTLFIRQNKAKMEKFWLELKSKPETTSKITSLTEWLIKKQLAESPEIESANIENAIQNKYEVSNSNLIWTLDETQRDGCFLTCVMDLSSRAILNFTIRTKPLDSASYLALIKETVEDFGTPRFVHTDLGGCFISNESLKGLKALNISPSLPMKYKKRSNQVHESFHTLLWRLLGLLRLPDTNVKSKSFHDVWRLLKIEQKTLLIVKAIDIYNHRVYKKTKPFSREQVDKALRMLDPKLNVNLQASGDSELANQIRLYRIYVTNAFAKNLGAVITPEELKKATGIDVLYKDISELSGADLTRIILSAIEKGTDFIVKKQSSLFKNLSDDTRLYAEEQSAYILQTNEKLASLQEEISKLKDQNSILVQALEEKQEKIKAKKEALAKRVHREPRKPVEDNEFFQVMELLSKSDEPLIVARDCLCASLLFFTGLRLQNLYRLTLADVKAFLVDKKSITITLIKVRNGQSQYHTLTYSKTFDSFACCDYSSFIDLLAANSPLGLNSKLVTVRRETLTRRLNSKLQAVGGKRLTTHSFRISFITRVSSSSGVEAASQLVGHKSSATTKLYDRSNLTAKKQKGIVSAAFPPIRRKIPVIELPKRQTKKKAPKSLDKNQTKKKDNN